MKTIITCLVIWIYSINIQGQVILNEVEFDQSWVEVKNAGDTVVNISQYYLVSGGSNMRLGQYFPACGGGLNFDLDPGEIFGFNGMLNLDWMDGEMALFRNNQFQDPTAIIGFVQWGAAGHPLEALAVTADVWVANDFVPAILSGGSLEYDGDGYASADWAPAAVSSLCDENGTSCNADIENVLPSNNPFTPCIGDGNTDGFSYTFNGNITQHQITVILNFENRIMGFSAPGSGAINLEWMTPADTVGLNWHLVGYNGPIGNVAVGNLWSDVVGCYYLSPSVPVVATFIHQGELQATYHDTLFTMDFALCSTDQIPDPIHFENTSPDEQTAFILINATTNKVYDIVIDSFILDVEGIPLTRMLVRSFSYVDTIQGQIGGNPAFVHGTGCDAWATNEILITLDQCASSSIDLSPTSLTISPNPVEDYVVISGIPAGPSSLYIWNTMGTLVSTQPINSNGEDLQLSLDFCPAGIYFINIIQKTGIQKSRVMKK